MSTIWQVVLLPHLARQVAGARACSGAAATAVAGIAAGAGTGTGAGKRVGTGSKLSNPGVLRLGAAADSAAAHQLAFMGLILGAEMGQ